MICIVPLLTAAIVPLFTRQSVIDVDVAKRYFQEAQWISDDDGGKLWGKKLYGPMVFVDAQTRTFIANQKPPEGDFSEQSGVYSGKLSDQIAMANTAIDWAGSRWTMVLWPLPQNRAERATLMMHELYHRIQPELGFPGASPQNAHLETVEGRLWLQLELKALSDALLTYSPDERDRNAKNALMFRQMRYRKFPAAKSEEDGLEINEGLAEFTGYMLRGGWEPESRMWMGNQVRNFVGLDTYSRRFAYKTGPAYAFLLNVCEATRFDEIRWKAKLASQPSIAGLLSDFYGLQVDKTDKQIIALAKPYGYDDLLKTETEREKERQKRIAAIRKKYIDGPTLLLPFVKMRVSFNPQNLVPLGEEGTFYPTATIIDEWGTIEVTDGVLIAGNWRSAKVVAPASVATSGPGWTIRLNPSWKLAPGKRSGDFAVVKG